MKQDVNFVEKRKEHLVMDCRVGSYWYFIKQTSLCGMTPGIKPSVWLIILPLHFWHMYLVVHFLKKVMHCNAVKLHLTAELLLKPLATFIKIWFCKAKERWRGHAQAHSSTGTIFVYYWFFGRQGQSPVCQRLKGSGQKTQVLHTHAPTDTSTCGSLWVYGHSFLRQPLPISFSKDSRESAGQQLPLHTNALQMKFIYSTPQLLLSLFLFLWIYSASLGFFLSQSSSPLSALCLLTCSFSISSSPSTFAIQLWQPACGPLGVDIRFYKLNWTQEQLQRRPSKMGPHAMLNAEAPL